MGPHADSVRALLYAPNGKLLASAGNDGRILVWDAAAGQVVTELAKLTHTISAIRSAETASCSPRLASATTCTSLMCRAASRSSS